MIACGIGIDYGNILVTKVGMYGVEKDETKEDEISFVWVGNSTNHASKYSDLTDGGEIFISEKAYNGLSTELNKEGRACPYNEKSNYTTREVFFILYIVFLNLIKIIKKVLNCE